MNPELDKLHPYPFEKLLDLKQGIEPPKQLSHIALSIGEPRHAAPGFVHSILAESLDRLSNYPLTKGMPELRQAISNWLSNRYQLPDGSLDADQHILPVTGTREALFAFAQAVINRHKPAQVFMPNPFYQIYEGAAILAGAEPYYMDTTEATGFIPDFDAVSEQNWSNCQLLYICSPGNPTGAVINKQTLQKLINLAGKHDFIIASDECYSEIYFDENQPPVGLLEAASEMGNTEYKRCMVFHSLSKRSNLPGLRSGFVAGDADIIRQFLRYRTYQGCATPPHHQLASIAAWQDEAHVRENRRLYREKFAAVLEVLTPVLDVTRPDASFYLWPKTPVDGAEFAQGLYARQNVTVLPGSYLSRDINGHNPGQQRVRMALVASPDECIEAARRIRNYIENL